MPRGGFCFRRTEEEWARARTEAVERRVYGPPLDGWPFEAGERDVAYPRLALLSEGGERWRDYAPPFGEVSF
ncbi:hypothetical protein [Thermus brockianus]